MKYRYNFFDEDNASYGLIETNEEQERIQKLLDKYKKSDLEEYNIDDFFAYLEKNKINFDILNTEPDGEFYF